MLGKQTNKAQGTTTTQKRRLPKTTADMLGRTYVPAYQDNHGPAGLGRTRGHRANTQLLFGHEEDIATTTKATPVFPLFALPCFFLVSFSFFVSWL